VIELFNPAAEEIFGYSPDDVTGREIGILIPEADRAEHDTYIRNYAAAGDPGAIGQDGVIEGLRKNGEEFPMSVGVGVIRTEHGVSFVETFTDLSELKMLEAQLMRSQRMDAIGQLTGGVAHDFNNVMTTIAGNLDLIKGSGVSDEVDQFADGALRGVDRGASLTQRLLAFSRQQALAPVEADITDLVLGLQEMLGRTLGERIDLRIDHSPDLRHARIDPGQFENALVNLTINARDSMPDGGILDVELSNTVLDEAYASQQEDLSPGNYVMVAVSDNGTGMPPEILERVFEPFFTTKDAGAGSGLGMSMVYGFVKQSRGHISIYSEPDTGTTVRLYLPESTTQNPIVQNNEATEKTGQSVGRILVVEDDADARSVAVKILRRHGHDVSEAADGAEALNLLTNHGPFDILFTDVVLPGNMDGVAVSREAHKLQPQIKTLFTSGYTENAIIHNGTLDEGVVLLDKPYRAEKLLSLIEGLLDA
jgi:PAS domain S-box-containing protein